MEATYYYAGGRRIEVSRLRAARVLRLRGERSVVARPGWRPFPLAQRRFQLLLRAEALEERDLAGHRVEQLIEALLRAEAELDDSAPCDEERALADEFGSDERGVLVGSEGGLLIPTGEVVARFAPELDAQAVAARVGERGGELLRTTSLPSTWILAPLEGVDETRLAARLVEEGAALTAAPDFIEEMPHRATDGPRGALVPQQWHLDNVGQNGATLAADVRAAEAWRITRGSPEVALCILDSGVQSDHEVFSAADKFGPGFDFEDEDPFPEPGSSSHGTSCAAIAAAGWEGGSVVGCAPGCRVMAVRRATLSEHSRMAEAFVWAADNGADVISCSFGYDHRPWVLPDVVRDAIDYAAEYGRGGRGCVIVWAAGNGGESVSDDEWATYERVITVAASTDADLRASYSDFGPEIDVCAPSSGGTNGITTASVGGYTSHFGGTSAAAPLVAGVVGLLLSLNPNLRPEEVRAILRSTADRIDPGNGAYDENGHSHLYGCGRVNAAAALHGISALEEVVRGSVLEERREELTALIDELLLPRETGRALVEALRARAFPVLALLRRDPQFRDAAVRALDGALDAYAVLATGGPAQLSEATWAAFEIVARSIVREPIDPQ